MTVLRRTLVATTSANDGMERTKPIAQQTVNLKEHAETKNVRKKLVKIVRIV